MIPKKQSPRNAFPTWWTICCPENGFCKMFSASYDDKHAIHEKMKRRVQAFYLGKNPERSTRRGFETGRSERKKEELIMNGMFILAGQ